MGKVTLLSPLTKADETEPVNICAKMAVLDRTRNSTEWAWGYAKIHAQMAFRRLCHTPTKELYLAHYPTDPIAHVNGGAALIAAQDKEAMAQNGWNVSDAVCLTCAMSLPCMAETLFGIFRTLPILPCRLCQE